jgi:hypothetical protein
MKRAVTAAVVALCLFIVAASWVRADPEPYEGTRFADVWTTITSDVYDELPSQRVTFSSFYGWFENRLLDASRRTLNDRADLLPPFQKLLHPNGICLAGTWHIEEETPYTGYFAQGSEGVIIARASTALSEVLRGQPRAFGLAGKLYPTDDFDHREPLRTANFFTIEDLAGTYRPYFLDAENTNDIIQVTPRPSALFKGPVGAAAAEAFAMADETIDLTQVFIRQLYPIAELGLAAGETAIAPRWMKIVGSPRTPRVDAADFRDELDMANYPDGIRLVIFVADEGLRLGNKAWRRIGEIHMTDSVTSYSCDHRLHFSHPRFRR